MRSSKIIAYAVISIGILLSSELFPVRAAAETVLEAENSAEEENNSEEGTIAQEENTGEEGTSAAEENNEDEDIETMIEDFYDVVSRVRKGGYVVIPKRTYWHFPCEMESIEILCECMDLTMEAPRMDWRDVIIVHM